MLTVDPIEDPNFNPARKREANPETIATIQVLALNYHRAVANAEARKRELAAAVREAKRAGHSYPQLAEAAGVSMGVIQRFVAGGGE